MGWVGLTKYGQKQIHKVVENRFKEPPWKAVGRRNSTGKPGEPIRGRRIFSRIS
jgi:hypothetical protein